MWHGHSDNDMESLGRLTFLDGETECTSGMIEYDLHANDFEHLTFATVIFVISLNLNLNFCLKKTAKRQGQKIAAAL